MDDMKLYVDMCSTI